MCWVLEVIVLAAITGCHMVQMLRRALLGGSVCKQ